MQRVPALRDATQAPEGVPETASKHIAFVNCGHEERLERRNREPEEAERQSMCQQFVWHSYWG